MSEATLDELKIKVVFIGSRGTGKSNVRARFCRGTFTQYSNSTVGTQLSSRKFWGPFKGKQEVFNLVCWDLCNDAQETIVPSFFKNALGVVYVYDSTRLETFQELENWRQLVLKHQNSQNFTQMVIGNKVDLTNFREVSFNEGCTWARNKQIPLFYETSALLNSNIEEAMQKLSENIVGGFGDSYHRPLKLVRKDVTHRGCC